MAEFDFRPLVNALIANNQFHLPPTDTIRMGIVVGYDPGFTPPKPATGAAFYSFPVVSVQLAGDDHPTHGIRFLESYVPNIGDTVWIMATGHDEWVVGSLAGSNKSTIGTVRSPMSLVGHTGATSGQTITTTTTPQPISATKITTSYLPNRIYRAEATVTFEVTGTTPYFSGTASSTYTGSATVSNTGTYSAYASLSGGNAWALATMIGYIRGTTGGSPTMTVRQGSGTTYTVNTGQLLQNLTGDVTGLNTLLSQSGNAYVTGFGLPANADLLYDVVFQSTATTQTVAGNTYYFNFSGGGLTPNPPFVILNSGSAFVGNNASGATEYPITTRGSVAGEAAFAGSPFSGTARGTGSTTNLTTVVNGSTSDVYWTTDSSNNNNENLIHNLQFTFVNYGAVSVTPPSPSVTVTLPTLSTSITDSSTPTLISLGVIAPSPWAGTTGSQSPANYQEMEVINVTGVSNKVYTVHCSTTFWDSPTQAIKTGQWKPTYDWHLGMKQIGSNSATIAFDSVTIQKFVVYDCGVNNAPPGSIA